MPGNCRMTLTFRAERVGPREELEAFREAWRRMLDIDRSLIVWRANAGNPKLWFTGDAKDVEFGGIEEL